MPLLLGTALEAVTDEKLFHYFLLERYAREALISSFQFAPVRSLWACSQPKTLRPPRRCDSRRSSETSASTVVPVAKRSSRRDCSSSRFSVPSSSSRPSFAADFSTRIV